MPVEIKNIFVRIGHGNFGISSETIDLMKNFSDENRIIIEINPISKIAFVLGTDGYGIYNYEVNDLFTIMLSNDYVKKTHANI